eukprot:Rmarinus@m.23901
MKEFERLPKHVYFDGKEVILLVLEFLRLGDFPEAMRTLERESGVVVESGSSDMSFLRTLILDGQWKLAESFLQPIMMHSEYTMKDETLFKLRKQQFLELVERQSDDGIEKRNAVVDHIVEVLSDLEELCDRTTYLRLCYCLTLPRLVDHPDYSHWTPYRGRVDTFESVKEIIESFLPSETVLRRPFDPNRLTELLSHAVQYQVLSLLKDHPTANSPSVLRCSLLEDVAPDLLSFPCGSQEKRPSKDGAHTAEGAGDVRESDSSPLDTTHATGPRETTTDEGSDESGLGGGAADGTHDDDGGGLSVQRPATARAKIQSEGTSVDATTKASTTNVYQRRDSNSVRADTPLVFSQGISAGAGGRNTALFSSMEDLARAIDSYRSNRLQADNAPSEDSPRGSKRHPALSASCAWPQGLKKPVFQDGPQRPFEAPYSWSKERVRWSHHERSDVDSDGGDVCSDGGDVVSYSDTNVRSGQQRRLPLPRTGIPREGMSECSSGSGGEHSPPKGESRENGDDDDDDGVVGRESEKDPELVSVPRKLPPVAWSISVDRSDSRPPPRLKSLNRSFFNLPAVSDTASEGRSDDRVVAAPSAPSENPSRTDTHDTEPGRPSRPKQSAADGRRGVGAGRGGGGSSGG